MRQDNKGYTLIELIVTLLVSSVVALATVGFWAVATKNYRLANAEVTLQLESQVTTNQISELIIESKAVAFETTAGREGGEAYKILAITGTEDGTDCVYYFVLNHNKNELLFAKDTDMTKTPSDIITQCLNSQEALLSRYITDLEITQIGTTLYQLTLSFQFDGRTFISSTNITSRND